MKKLALLLAFVLLVSLFGCAGGAADVQTLKNWSFQYNEGTNDYSIFFALLTKSERYVAAEVDVDVRIVSEDGTEVYRATHAVTEENFANYTSQIHGEEYLAHLRIPASAVAPGTSASGKVYLTVHKGDALRFDEVNCDAFYCLPLLDASVVVTELPVELEVREWDGAVSSRIRVEEVKYLHEKEYTSTLRITVAGTKTYGEGGIGYDVISYKLYDSEGYVVDSGDLFLDKLSEGDKFRDDTIAVSDAIPGECYTIEFFEHSWP